MQSLSWLVAPPADFNERCKHLEDSDDIGAEILRLSRYDLSLNQSHRLHRTIKNSERAQEQLRLSLTPFKLGLVSNGTLDLLVPMLVTSALRYGIALDVITTDFDQAVQEAIDPESHINRSKPDAILVALDFNAFPFGCEGWAKSPEDTEAGAGLELLSKIRAGFRRNCGAVCIVQTLAMPPRALMGNLDCQTPGLLRSVIGVFNAELISAVSADADIILDIAGIVEQVGASNWFDERQWFMARIPLSNEFIPLYCEHVSRVVAASRGKTRKCLILDLDNTLWGGVIGDDGIEGITLGHGNALGEAYLALHKYAKELRSVGIILAVCSKNDDLIARRAFREHPEMLLKEDDFAVFVANWEDKASNIRHIARELNIGLDALVFVDDNPAERDIVRTFLPQVAVPELPADPALVPRTVAAAGYFEMLHLNEDDIRRSEQYAANTRRHTAMADSSSIDEYLQSLQMEMSFAPFDGRGRKRIAQLINKTNQFNLTTKRRTEADVQSLEASPDYFTLQVRLADRFGDNGMVSVVICKKQELVWEIDTWLMSCRIIKRRAEEAICDELVRQAKSAGVATLRGVYKPTERNDLVRNHYQEMGFTMERCDTESEIWTLELSAYSNKNPPIRITDLQKTVAAIA